MYPWFSLEKDLMAPIIGEKRQSTSLTNKGDAVCL